MKTKLFIILLALSAGVAAHDCPEWIEVETELGLQILRASHIKSVTSLDSGGAFIIECVPFPDVEERCSLTEIPKSSYKSLRDALICGDVQNNDLN